MPVGKKPRGNQIYAKVELLGYGKVDFIRTEKGLEVNLPEAGLNEIAPVLKIRL